MSFLGPVTTLGGRLVRPHDIEVSTAHRATRRASPAGSSALLRVGFEVRLTVELEEADHPNVEVTVTRATQRHLRLEEGLHVWVSPTNGARSHAAMRVVGG